MVHWLNRCAVKGEGLQPLACWDHGFKHLREQGCLSLVSVVCCLVEASTTSRSLVERTPTDCVCVCAIESDRISLRDAARYVR